ncbi:hypothetical protein M9458_006622, partial [Cirrhinus mrigala]
KSTPSKETLTAAHVTSPSCTMASGSTAAPVWAGKMAFTGVPLPMIMERTSAGASA